MSGEEVECVVVGAGVVGLAIARELARCGCEVIILEANARVGEGVSARNSGVIHAGLYYPSNSLKARLCLRGRDLLYEFCAEHHVECQRIGKLVVAENARQEVALRMLQKNAEASGARGLRWLDTDALRQIEPQLLGVAALESPNTGIVDVHAYLLALLADAEAHGALLVRSAPLVGGARAGDGLRLRVGADADEVQARIVINAAALSAWQVAASLGVPVRKLPARQLAKGNYFSYGGGVPFQRLIYPMPGAAGLGVHLTFDLQRCARFGPDVEWIEREEYAVNEARHARFVEAIQRYWPALDPDRLTPDFAGIRPKLVGAGEAAADFMVQGPADHSIPGLINLFGIESPGLTASLALAEYVAKQLAR